MSDALNKPNPRHARILATPDHQPPLPHVEPAADAAFEQLFRGAPMPMWIYDLDTLEFVRVNRAATEKYGYPADKFLRMHVQDLHPQDEVRRLRNHVREICRDLPSSRRIARYWRHRLASGKFIWADTYSQPFDYQGRHCAIVSATDATRRKEAEEHLKVQNAYFRQLFDASPEAIVLLDRDDHVVDINRRFQEMFGYELDELRGVRLESRLVPDFLQREVRESYQRMGRAGRLHERTQRRRKGGALAEVAISAFPIEVEKASVGTYLMYTDLGETPAKTRREPRPRPEAAMGMLERSDLIAELGRRRHAEMAQGHTLLFLDLDQFARINQDCGHNAGDMLLLRVSEVIRGHAGSDQAAYLGSDEYALLLDGVDEARARSLAQEISAAVAAIRFRWDGRLHQVGVSVGIVVIREPAISSREQLGMAETACRVAKAKGPNGIHAADSATRSVLQWEDDTIWSTKVRSALTQQRFVLYAQRLTPLRQQDAPRHEILLRMVNEDGSLASPSRFLMHAARMGAVREIDDWVLGTVLQALSAGGVHEHWAGTLHLNVGEESLRDAEIGARVVQRLGVAGVNGSRLCFEISEAAASRNPGRTRRFTETVRAAGCQVALDDFGAELTSLQSLRDLPADYLKIDGAFVERLSEDQGSQAVVEGLSVMARQLGIKTVAECVDNNATLECVHTLGVDFAQGYGVHRPEPFYPTRPL